MNHLEINLKCTGDVITAIAESCKIAAFSKRRLYLDMPNGVCLSISEGSEVHDIFTIYQLETKLKTQPHP